MFPLKSLSIFHRRKTPPEWYVTIYLFFFLSCLHTKLTQWVLKIYVFRFPSSAGLLGEVAWPSSQTFDPVLLLRNKTASFFLKKKGDSTISLKEHFFLHCICETIFNSILRNPVTIVTNMYCSSCKIWLTNSSSTCEALPPTLPATWVFPLQKIISMKVSFQDSVWSIVSTRRCIFELLQELLPYLRAPTSKIHMVWHLTR